MKILRAYKCAEDKQKLPYCDNSPIMKEMTKLYDVEEIVLEHGYKEEDYAATIRNYDVLITMWGSPHVPNELAENPGKLRYICNITGEIGNWIDEPIVASPYITITNWGDAAGYSVAEGAVSLLMTQLKEIPVFIDHTKNGKEPPEKSKLRNGTLFRARVGIYGMGFIGRKFVEYIKPFMPDIYAFDPYVDNMPEGVTKVNSLEELFAISQIMVIHAGWTPETEKSVTKELLAMLPDGAVFINTARGQIVDEHALMAEVMSGRIRAGLDVLDQSLNPGNGDMPAVDDPVRQVTNAVFTGHHIAEGEWSSEPETLDFAARNALDNLASYAKGEPLRFIIDVDRYRKMT